MEWSYRELYMLRNHYSTSTKEKLLELLPDRTISAINQKARKEGLKKD